MSQTKPKKATDATSKNASYRNAAVAPDIFEIQNCHPDRVYRWVSRRNIEKNGFDSRGWIPLNEANSKGEAMYSPYGNAPKGREMQMEDLVCAFMDKETNELRKAQKASHRDRMRGSLDTLRGQTASIGMRPDIDIQLQRPGQQVERL